MVFVFSANQSLAAPATRESQLVVHVQPTRKQQPCCRWITFVVYRRVSSSFAFQKSYNQRTYSFE